MALCSLSMGMMRAPVLRRSFAEQFARQNHRFLVGQSDGLAGLYRHPGRKQSCRTHGTGYDNVDFSQLRRWREALLPR